MSRSVRTLGVALVLAIAGAAGGYGVGALQVDDPVTISMALPVPAEDPSYPVVEYDVTPDPGLAPLPTGIALARTRLRFGGTPLELAVPRGWTVGGKPGKWIYSSPDQVQNSYYVRVETLNNQRSVGVELNSRIDALREAQSDGNLDHVLVEEESDDEFVATYLQGGYQRVSMERFLDLGTTSAYVTIAVIGRERDREGMADLLERICASVQAP